METRTEEEGTITLPLIEFGEAVYVSSALSPASDEIDPAAKQILDKKIKHFREVVSYISDARWYQEPEIIVGPLVDKLQRFRPIGWRGMIASAGYGKLREHFAVELACRKRHQPDKVDFAHVRYTIRRWFKDMRRKNDDD
jgi:hypothetical protein